MFLLNILALLVTVAGAINLGLVGFFNYNFINMILGGPISGTYTVFSRIVFAIIGIAGVWSLSFLSKPKLFKNCGCPNNKK